MLSEHAAKARPISSWILNVHTYLYCMGAWKLSIVIKLLLLLLLVMMMMMMVVIAIINIIIYFSWILITCPAKAVWNCSWIIMIINKFQFFCYEWIREWNANTCTNTEIFLEHLFWFDIRPFLSEIPFVMIAFTSNQLNCEHWLDRNVISMPSAWYQLLWNVKVIRSHICLINPFKMTENKLNFSAPNKNESVKSTGNGYVFNEMPIDCFKQRDKIYTRKHRLGHGAFAYCFLYESPTNDKLVAKISSKYRGTNKSKNRHTVLNFMWQNELQLLQTLNHFNIVKCHGFKEVRNLQYISVLIYIIIFELSKFN